MLLSVLMSMSDSEGGWYPRTLGCTQQKTARAYERVKDEGKANLIKSRGQMKDWLDAKPRSPASDSRSDSYGDHAISQADMVATKNRGTIGKWLNVEENIQSGYQSARPAPHCPTPIAHDMRQKATGSMASYIGSDSQYPSMPSVQQVHPRAIRSEARMNAAPHRGTRMESLIYDPLSIPQPPPPPPCIKPEAEDIARKHDGAGMARLITKYGTMPVSERYARVTHQGAQNADLQKGQRIKQLINEQQPSASTKQIDVQAALDKIQQRDNFDRRNKTTFSMAWT